MLCVLDSSVWSSYIKVGSGCVPNTHVFLYSALFLSVCIMVLSTEWSSPFMLCMSSVKSSMLLETVCISLYLSSSACTCNL